MQLADLQRACIAKAAMGAEAVADTKRRNSELAGAPLGVGQKTSSSDVAWLSARTAASAYAVAARVADAVAERDGVERCPTRLMAGGHAVLSVRRGARWQAE